MVVHVGDELPGGGLPEDRQPGQRDQPASTHQPTACGLMARCTAAASMSRSSAPSDPSGRIWLSKAAWSAAPCRSRRRRTAHHRGVRFVAAA